MMSSSATIHLKKKSSASQSPHAGIGHVIEALSGLRAGYIPHVYVAFVLHMVSKFGALCSFGTHCSSDGMP